MLLTYLVKTPKNHQRTFILLDLTHDQFISFPQRVFVDAEFKIKSFIAGDGMVYGEFIRRYL